MYLFKCFADAVLTSIYHMCQWGIDKSSQTDPSVWVFISSPLLLTPKYGFPSTPPTTPNWINYSRFEETYEKCCENIIVITYAEVSRVNQYTEINYFHFPPWLNHFDVLLSGLGDRLQAHIRASCLREIRMQIPASLVWLRKLQRFLCISNAKQDLFHRILYL